MKKTVITLSLLALAASPLHAAEKLSPEELKTLYTVGVNVARSLAVFNLTPAELEVVIKGLTETKAGLKPTFDLTVYNQKVQDFAKARRKATGEKQAVAGKEYLEKAAREKNASKSPSGMVYIPLIEGKGNTPTATDTVKVNYRGTLIDGVTEFDSSYKRGKTSEFKLNTVIKCWTEGVQKMKPGGKARLVCPPELAYGDNGAGELILPGATLNFEIELAEVKPATATKAAAPPVSSKPAKAGEK
ncbi:MAG TPA: FKBP-type peptidyl-prolyl cis-trans isomerase [Desulfuromonadales bacterium]|nr:FKBP-type peptidyl-prolyl cis-trans isomerase [Desulfuromonadales bacterium]